MKPFWITFDDGTHGCCEGSYDTDAKRIAEHLTGKKAVKVESLPYPARPSIWQFEHPVNGKCPDFCRSPSKCAGHNACPHNRSCTS